MIHNKFRYILTLVALFAMMTGAWADGKKVVLKVDPITVANGSEAAIEVKMDYTTSKTLVGLSFSLYLPDGILLKGFDTKEAQDAAKASELKRAFDINVETGLWGNEEGASGWFSVKKQVDGSFLINIIDQDDKTPFVNTHAPVISINVHAVADVSNVNGTINGITLTDNENNSVEQGNIAEVTIPFNATAQEPDPNAVAISWDNATKTATIASMPGYDVMLTPIYAAATVYGSDGQTEKSAYETLKEAILAAQNGDVIKLEGDVTLADGNELSTAHRATEDPVQFTLDFNGYTLDGLNVAGMCLTAAHEGDQITFTDSSEGQTGGLKGTVQGAPNSLVFDGGRYNFKGMTAAQIKDMWSSTLVPNGFALANGKEFIDIENDPDANGFLVRVAYKDFELAIGPQKFVTFYHDQNVKLDEATSGVTVYTVSGIDTDRSLAYVSPVSGVVAKETPILLYNATDNELTAKLTVTPDDATAVDVAPEFKGTAEAREFTATDMAAADYYALIGGKAFAPVYNPGTIGANKCWLQFAKQQTPGARSINLVFEGGQTTGISVVSGSPADANAIYDLNGRRVTAPAKGVYIQNGKKVVK